MVWNILQPCLINPDNPQHSDNPDDRCMNALPVSNSAHNSPNNSTSNSASNSPSNLLSLHSSIVAWCTNDAAGVTHRCCTMQCVMRVQQRLAGHGCSGCMAWSTKQTLFYSFTTEWSSFNCLRPRGAHAAGNHLGSLHVRLVLVLNLKRSQYSVIVCYTPPVCPYTY